MKMKYNLIRHHTEGSIRIAVLFASVILLAGCPEFKSVKQPAKAFVNSRITVELEILNDTTRSEGNLSLELPY